MQTFLPYPSFDESAAVLDRQRLGKQRVEVLQLLNALGGFAGAGWRNHPAARMWSGHRRALCFYGLVVCEVWSARGYADTCAEKIRQRLELLPEVESAAPPWLGDARFHRAHRSNLLRKDQGHYGVFWSDVPNDLPYLWPELRDGGYALRPGEAARVVVKST
jgi:hypothetical protein